MKAARKAARRNAEENWLAYQRGKQYRIEKQDAHARPGNDNAKRDDQVSGKTDHRVSTARPIATRSLGVKSFARPSLPGGRCPFRNDLSELEKGIQHAERKQIYETLHPEAKNGAKGGWHNNKTENLETANLAVSSYAADAATATGCSESTVRRNTRFGEVLKPYRAELTGTVIEDNQRELLMH